MEKENQYRAMKCHLCDVSMEGQHDVQICDLCAAMALEDGTMKQVTFFIIPGEDHILADCAVVNGPLDQDDIGAMLMRMLLSLPVDFRDYLIGAVCEFIDSGGAGEGRDKVTFTKE